MSPGDLRVVRTEERLQDRRNGRSESCLSYIIFRNISMNIIPWVNCIHTPGPPVSERDQVDDLSRVRAIFLYLVLSPPVLPPDTKTAVVGLPGATARGAGVDSGDAGVGGPAVTLRAGPHLGAGNTEEQNGQGGFRFTHQ